MHFIIEFIQLFGKSFSHYDAGNDDASEYLIEASLPQFIVIMKLLWKLLGKEKNTALGG
jgi:hypothetical protein